MRYDFFDHPSKLGWFRVIDTKWMMVCDFKAHEFHKTQVFPSMGLLDDDPMQVMKVMREMGEWLYTHHYSDVMPAPPYELRLSEDGTRLHVLRHKDPVMDAVFETGDLNAIANALAKAAEYIRKKERVKR